MLEDIRIKVMKRLKNLEEEGKKWTEDYSPYAMALYNDFRIIAQGCQVVANGYLGYEVAEGIDRHIVNLGRKKCTCRTWDLTGIPCSHAIKALEHDRQEPLNEMHWWYSKDAYILVYLHKIQPVRGEKFCKVDPSQDMKPPEICKFVGRPKLKRLQRGREVLQDVPVSTPQPSEEIESVFMLTPEFVASSSQQTSQQSNQVINEAHCPSKRSKVVAPSSPIVDEDEVEVEIESEDETVVGPRVISKEKTTLQMQKLHQQPIGSRRISFRVDESGVNMPTNLPYSPKKLAWKGKACVTSNQLTKKKEIKIGKLKAKRGKH